MLCSSCFLFSGYFSVRACKQQDVSVGLSCAFLFSSLETFKTTLPGRLRKYKTSLSPFQDLPLFKIVNFSRVFMAFHLKLNCSSFTGTRMLVSRKLQQTKVLKTVSSTVKILVSHCTLYQLMLHSWYKKPAQSLVNILV